VTDPDFDGGKRPARVSAVVDIVWRFWKEFGRWPMWLSVQWRLNEWYDVPPEEVDTTIREAINGGEVLVTLDRDTWWIELDEKVTEAMAARDLANLLEGPDW
jgi:hypothetical protein